LFVGNCGRIDLPGGSSRDLYHSLFDIIANLSDELILYPGHDYGSSPTSTIGSEKRTNLVMQKVSEVDFVQRMGG
jgi:glyoxylase-like metal-dependent hydrolase (beta-lactamase superfamily II)